MSSVPYASAVSCPRQRCSLGLGGGVPLAWDRHTVTKFLAPCECHLSPICRCCPSACWVPWWLVLTPCRVQASPGPQ